MNPAGMHCFRILFRSRSVHRSFNFDSDAEEGRMAYRDGEFQNAVYCGTLTKEIRAIINIIWKIDFSHEVDLLKIENSNLADDPKQGRKFSIILEHHERRQPYVERLNEHWQKQCRRSLVA
ncbi:hypothetical protein AAII07_24160 [Microvirga sp. 0TCS3.31]